MTQESTRNKPSLPSIEKIEELLSDVQPLPSPEFHARMMKAPWHNPRIDFYVRRWNYSFLVILVVLFFSLLIFPSLRANARNWVLYFIPGRQDQMQLSIDDLSPQELFQYASPNNFPFTVSQAGAMAGFRVEQPDELLPGMELVGARYESNTESVVLLYQGAGYNLFMSQRPIAAGLEYFSVGASAEVEVVLIGEIQAEYVAGGWINLPIAQGDETSPPEDLNVVWDPMLSQYTLRWQSDGIAYQLRSTGSSGPQKFDLITLAESIR